MDFTRPMVIVGAGHVGGRAAQALREFGWHGSIVMIGAEPHPPYERPPLSKGVLTGHQDAASCALGRFGDDEGAPFERIVAAVTAIDCAMREVVIAAGSRHVEHRIAYESLLLATGGRARRLQVPGAGHPDILALRTLDDASALARRLLPGVRVLIVGGGFIGLEVAASARQRGCEVTLLEGADRLLGRVVPAAIAAKVLALHRDHRVDVRLDAAPVAFEHGWRGGHVVTLVDGERLAADVVVVGIGIEPATELAHQAGLTVGRGIVVDALLATSAPGIFAAGDVAEFPSPISGRPIRQETWQNAEAQARVAAANMLGGHVTCTQMPWFWSDQFDHQLQVCGEPALGERTVTRAWSDDASIDFHLDATGGLVGASGFGPTAAVAKELKLARLLVERRGRPAADALADPAVKLKSLV